MESFSSFSYCLLPFLQLHICFRLVWNHWVFGPALVALIHNLVDSQPMTSCFIIDMWETESDIHGRRDTISVSPNKFTLWVRSNCNCECVFCWYSKERHKTLKVSILFFLFYNFTTSKVYTHFANGDNYIGNPCQVI